MQYLHIYKLINDAKTTCVCLVRMRYALGIFDGTNTKHTVDCLFLDNRMLCLIIVADYCVLLTPKQKEQEEEVINTDNTLVRRGEEELAEK